MLAIKAMPLQPNRVPPRIVSDTFHQPCPQRVGGDIPRCGDQVFVLAQRAVMEASLPDTRACTAGDAVDGNGASGLEALEYARQWRWAQLNEPVRMVRHHDPGRRVDVLLNLTAQTLLICMAPNVEDLAW